MRRLLALAFSAALILAATNIRDAYASHGNLPRCGEEDSWWNSRTMGNHVSGLIRYNTYR